MRTLWGASRQTRIAARYIPAGSTAIEREGGIVYTYEKPSPRTGEPMYLAIAYRGTAGKSTWHYSYRTEAQRQAKIDEFFAGLKSHAEFREQMKAERKQDAADRPSAKTGEYSLTETAELVRRALREIFPLTKFSVRSSSYSGGSSINVGWVDGPTERQVRPILQSFEGADFDGMQDLKTYKSGHEWQGRRVRLHVDFVHGQRRISASTLTAASILVARHCDLPALDVAGDDYPCLSGGNQMVPWVFRDGVFAHDPSRGEIHQQLVYQVAAQISQEAAAARPDLPQEITPAYIDDVVRYLLESH